MEIDSFIVDVFAEPALKGNPPAVVMGAAGLSTERMQAIAQRENSGVGARVTDVRVGGSTVLVAKRRLFLP